MKFPCLEVISVIIPESLNDNGRVKIVFNDSKLDFQFSILDFVNNSFEWTAIKTNETGYVWPVGNINVEGKNKLIKHWGLFINSSKIEKIIAENKKELKGGHLSDVCGETLIISGWERYDYKLVLIPFNK